MVELTVVSPDSETGREALRGFFGEVSEVLLERPVGADEVSAVMHENVAPGLEPPTGVLLVAQDEAAQVIGCAGLKLIGDGIGEVKHVHVVAAARGQGLGVRLMGEIEQRAREAGCSSLRLDTRANLMAARRLYVRLGFVEVPRFNDNPYAQCWYEKPLT